MENKEIFRHIDHTLLKPTATWAEIQALCEEAITYKTATVCVPPAYVARIREFYGGTLRICTVIGFPLGYSTTAVKAQEARDAILNGADEIDMVVNLTDVKNGLFPAVTEEIAALRRTVKEHALKVIIETCYLTQEEKIALCRCVSDGGADFIKTSTGFGTGGATMEDVLLLKAHIAPHIKIKASGGIRTREDMEAYLNAGCERLGTSSAVKALVE